MSLTALIHRAPQFLRYLLAGGLSALCNFGARIGLSVWLPFEVAVMGAFLVGLTTGFILMKYLAFPPSSLPLSKQIAGYALVNAYGGIQTLVLSSILLRVLLPAVGIQHHADSIAHALALAALALTSYHGHRRITFR